MAVIGLVIGARSSGFSPSGGRGGGGGGVDGNCGGISGGGGFVSFISLQVVVSVQSKCEKAHKRMEHGFVKIAFERIFAQKLHGQAR